MSNRGKVCDLLFGGHKDPLTRIILQVDSATSPNGVITAEEGTFLLVDYHGNDADDDIYINTDGSTTWRHIHDGSA